MFPSLILIVGGLFVCQLAFSQQDQPSAIDAGALFQQHCAKCHGTRGEGVNAAVTIAGPPLLAVHEPGDAMMAMEVGPSHMPSVAFVLSLPQMKALAHYVTHDLAEIPLEGGNLSDGGKKFRVYCASCHRTAVRGGALTFAGINAPALTGKSKAMIAGAIRQGPGPMPAFPPSILNDKDLASIVDYVKFAEQPPSPGGTPLNFYGPVAEGFVAWVFVFGLVAITGWIEKGGKG